MQIHQELRSLAFQLKAILSLDEIEEASSAYAVAEEKYAHDPGANVALVSVESLAALRDAYPSYFLDASGFLTLLRSVLKAQP